MARQAGGSVVWELDLDNSKFNSQLSRSRDQMSDTAKEADSLGSRINNSFKSAERGSKVLLGSIVAIGAGLAALFTKFVLKGGFDRALNIEDAQFKLKGLGHEAESVEKIMDSALAAVLGTAFALDEAATVAAAAVASGVKPGQELEKYLRLTADAATIAGISMDDMGLIMNKVTASQRVMAQDLNMMTSRGIPILQWLADEYGVTAGELRTMVSQGEVDAETFRKVIEENVSGAALSAGETTRGAWANMQAAMARVGAQIAQEVLPKINDAIAFFTQWFDDNADKIVKATMRIVGGFIRFGEGVARIFREENRDMLIIFAGAIIGALVPAFWALAASIWATFAPLLPFLAAGAALGALALVIKNNWDKIEPTFNRVRDALRNVWNITKPLRDFIAGQFKKAWDDIRKAFNDVRASLEPFMPQLRTLAKVIAVAVIAPMAAAVIAIVAVVTVVAIIIAAIARLVGWFANLGNSVRSNMLSFRQSILNGINTAVNFFRALPGRIVSALGNMGNLLRSSGRALIDGFVSGIKSVANKPREAVRDAVSGLRDMLPFSDAKEGPLSDLTKSGMRFSETFAEGIEKGMGGLINTANSAMGSMSMEMTPAMQVSDGSSVTNHIGTINIASEVDGEDWLKRLGRDDEITQKGLTNA